MFISMVLGCILICFTTSLAAEDIKVATAANFKLTLEKIVEEYEISTGHKVIVITASSGVLFTQINHGAPFDVFLSADAERPSRLAEKNHTETFIYAIGQLAFWLPKQVPRHGFPVQAKVDGRSLMAFEANLAIANPRIAPYGIAAMHTLGHLKPGFKNLVRGKNVNQAFQFVESGNARAGLVALSQLGHVPTSNYWLIPEDLYAPIEQHGILLAPNDKTASHFVGYLQSPGARAIIARSGYRLPWPAMSEDPRR